MSLEAFIAVKRLRGISATERCLLYAMADYADRAGHSVFPSVPTLAEELDVDDRTIQRTMRSLETAGLLVKAGMSGRAPYQTVVYSLPFVEGWQSAAPTPRTEPAVTSVSPPEVTVGVTLGVTSGVAPVSPDPVIRRSVDPSINQRKVIDLRAGQESGVRHRLWDVYTQLTMRLTPSPVDEQQFDLWEANGLTIEQIDGALTDTVAASPERAWPYFKTVLGDRIAKAAVPEKPKPPTLTAAEVQALREARATR